MARQKTAVNPKVSTFCTEPGGRSRTNVLVWGFEWGFQTGQLETGNTIGQFALFLGTVSLDSSYFIFSDVSLIKWFLYSLVECLYSSGKIKSKPCPDSNSGGIQEGFLFWQVISFLGQFSFDNRKGILFQLNFFSLNFEMRKVVT